MNKDRLFSGLAGLLWGLGTLTVYALRFGFSDWSVYTPGRIVGLLFGIVCLVAGIVYIALALMGPRDGDGRRD